MRLFISMILLLIASVVQAEHHRGHAVTHMDDSLRFLDAALVIAENNRDDPATPEQASYHLNKYLIYAGKYRNRIEAARELLLTGGNLEDIRRLVSAPGFGAEKESADYGIAITVSILAVAVREGGNSFQMSMILTRHSKADQFLGWAHWHVIDAVREEIYQDPEFQ